MTHIPILETPRLRIRRPECNPHDDPPWLQVVGILENTQNNQHIDKLEDNNSE